MIARLVGMTFALTTTAVLVPPAWASQGSATDEVVAVDERDLDAYWRRDTAGHDMAELSGSDLGLYGCIAVPFTLHPDGRRDLGVRPLLVKLGQARGERVQRADLYPIAVGAMPQFVTVWDKPLSASIYSSYSVVVAEGGLKARLGPAKWTVLLDKLRAACQISGLADWIGQNKARTVEQDLPTDPEQFLR